MTLIEERPRLITALLLAASIVIACVHPSPRPPSLTAPAACSPWQVETKAGACR